MGWADDHKPGSLSSRYLSGNCDLCLILASRGHSCCNAHTFLFLQPWRISICDWFIDYIHITYYTWRNKFHSRLRQLPFLFCALAQLVDFRNQLIFLHGVTLPMSHCQGKEDEMNIYHQTTIISSPVHHDHNIYIYIYITSGLLIKNIICRCNPSFWCIWSPILKCWQKKSCSCHMIRKQEPLIPLRRIRGQYALMRINSNANKGANKLCQMKWMTHKCIKGTVLRDNITFRFTFLFCQSTITTQFKSISGSILHHPNNTVRLIFDTWCFRCRSTASLCISSKSIFSTPPTLILSSIVCSTV